MEKISNLNHLTEFEFEGQKQKVSFIETMDVADGVTCDVYKFVGDDTKDLGIIKIKSGHKTPLQRVLKGDRTVEGYISGTGKLVVSNDGIDKPYEVKDGDTLSVSVNIGETMQWIAGEDNPLTAYEICFPPYEDGRYENLN